MCLPDILSTCVFLLSILGYLSFYHKIKIIYIIFFIMSISELLFLKIKEKAALQMATHPYAAFSRSEFISITWGVNDIGHITESYSVNSVV